MSPPSLAAACRPPTDAEVAAATLACLPDITPRRLALLVEHFGGPTPALAAVQRGHAAVALPATGRPTATPAARRALARTWAATADPARVSATLASRGTHVWLRGTPAYPIQGLDGAPGLPAVLLGEGALTDALAAPRVAIVGTRAATPHGLADARELGAVLGEAGVTVVSGLAIGIDAAAHEGALDAGGVTVGVVATGLDVIYPRRHVVLFDRVRRHGLVLGETGFGVPPHAARFPVRNRIIAALADVVVVVEATVSGGARITAEHALRYGRSVLAVPGSRRNPAAVGCNALLADGAHPLLDPSDVLLAVGLSASARWPAPEPPASLSADGAAALRALAGEPATLDQLAGRTGLAPGALALALVELERAGRALRSRGLWWPT